MLRREETEESAGTGRVRKEGLKLGEAKPLQQSEEEGEEGPDDEEGVLKGDMPNTMDDLSWCS